MLSGVRKPVWCWNGDYGEAVATTQEWSGILEEVRFWWDNHRRDGKSFFHVKVAMPLGWGGRDVKAGLELSEGAERAL